MDEQTKTQKTLPMKLKAMHYAVIAFIHSSDVLTPEQKTSLLETVPIHASIEEQIEYYTKYSDFKQIDNDVIKPMKKQKKEKKSKNLEK